MHRRHCCIEEDFDAQRKGRNACNCTSGNQDLESSQTPVHCGDFGYVCREEYVLSHLIPPARSQRLYLKAKKTVHFQSIWSFLIWTTT